MAKFVIECPNCQSYVRVSNSIFAKKQVRCNCGTLIDIKANRMMSRVCPHCGNSVVFDAAKGEKAKCPVCKEHINTTAEQSRTEEFSCSQCGIRLRADKNATHYRCPVCDTDNDVQAQIAKERISRQGVASIIKYEGDNQTFIWKHPIEDFNLGSQLIVHETQEAVFFRAHPHAPGIPMHNDRSPRKTQADFAPAAHGFSPPPSKSSGSHLIIPGLLEYPAPWGSFGIGRSRCSR